MDGKFKEEHWLDNEGRPEGGVAFGDGFAISWQHGPLGRGAERKEPNGAFVETVLRAVKGRIDFYQGTQFNCEENAAAVDFIEKAISSLNSRTARREFESTEGTHVGN